MPLLRQLVIGALIYGFVRSMTTVSAIVFLVTHRSGDDVHHRPGGHGDYGVAIAYCAVLILMAVAPSCWCSGLSGRAEVWAPPSGTAGRANVTCGSRWIAPAPNRNCRFRNRIMNTNNDKSAPPRRARAPSSSSTLSRVHGTGEAAVKGLVPC